MCVDHIGTVAGADAGFAVVAAGTVEPFAAPAAEVAAVLAGARDAPVEDATDDATEDGADDGDDFNKPSDFSSCVVYVHNTTIESDGIRERRPQHDELKRKWRTAQYCTALHSTA